jgi:hypothetical protein
MTVRFAAVPHPCCWQIADVKGFVLRVIFSENRFPLFGITR